MNTTQQADEEAQAERKKTLVAVVVIVVLACVSLAVGAVLLDRFFQVKQNFDKAKTSIVKDNFCRCECKKSFTKRIQMNCRPCNQCLIQGDPVSV